MIFNFQSVCNRRALARMMSVMKAEIIKRESIKPSSPTPHHLRSFKLSLLDQLSLPIYSGVVFFYPLHGVVDRQAKANERSECLQKSLSKVLTCFYPLAGRIKDHVSIDCNDDGADYLEARVNGRLSDFLRQPEDKTLDQFLPIDTNSTEVGAGPLLLVQASFFNCGGMAIGVCLSHKIADAATVSTFIKSWATAALEPGDVELPIYIAASLFPPVDFSTMQPTFKMTTEKCITRRYVFNASNITALKAKAASASMQQPTRVETVSALIWKCAMTASRSNLGSVRPSVLTYFVNIRNRTVPPLPENSLGNLIGLIAVQSTEENEIDHELHTLVGHIRKGITNFCDNYAEKLRGEGGSLAILESIKEGGKMFNRDDIDLYTFSSVCRLPLYEVDFGWGKPTWVSVGWKLKNVVLLLDTRGGDGIEAWVTLDEDDMAVFERDRELLAFASLNPSVLD